LPPMSTVWPPASIPIWKSFPTSCNAWPPADPGWIGLGLFCPQNRAFPAELEFLQAEGMVDDHPP
jgi:hypothetical protein